MGQADGSQEINLSVRKIELLVGEGRDERGGTVEEGIIFLASRMTPETFLPWPFGALEPPLQLLLLMKSEKNSSSEDILRL